MAQPSQACRTSRSSVDPIHRSRLTAASMDWIVNITVTIVLGIIIIVITASRYVFDKNALRDYLHHPHVWFSSFSLFILRSEGHHSSLSEAAKKPNPKISLKLNPLAKTLVSMKQLLQYVFISSQDLKKFWENIQIISVLSNFNYKTPPPFNPEYLGSKPKLLVCLWWWWFKKERKNWRCGVLSNIYYRQNHLTYQYCHTTGSKELSESCNKEGGMDKDEKIWPQTLQKYLVLFLLLGQYFQFWLFC